MEKLIQPKKYNNIKQYTNFQITVAHHIDKPYGCVAPHGCYFINPIFGNSIWRTIGLQIPESEHDGTTNISENQIT